MSDKLLVKTIFAMPVGPPHGGMTTYTEMLRRSKVFANGQAVLFDTTPPASRRFLRRFWTSLGRIWNLIALVRREKAAIVYLMTSDYLGFYEKSITGICCRLMGVKTVLHPVGSFVNFYGSSRGRRWLIRFLLRRQSAVITVQRRVQTYVRRLAGRTLVWEIPNPVDCNRLTRANPSTPVNGVVQILFVGALVKQKGVLDLLEAVRLNKVALENARVLIVGAGDLFEVCQRQIDANGLGSLVELKGFVDDPTKEKLLEEGQVFCLPSHSEGMPISVLEAMASGLPVVATTVGGIPLAVQNGTHGWLVAPGDVSGLGRCLVHLVRNQEVRAMMGRNGFEYVRQHFDISIVATHFIERFNSLAGRGRTAEPRSEVA